MHAMNNAQPPARPPRRSPWPLALGLAAALSSPARAELPAPGPSALPEDSGRLPLWEVGVVAAGGSQQAYPGSKQQVHPLVALPFLIYRGKVLRAGQGGVGLRTRLTDTTELDVGFSGSFGSAANDNPVRRGLPDIGTLVEFGPRLTWQLGAGFLGGQLSAALPVRGVFDLNHQFGLRGVAVEPSLAWGTRQGAWAYGGSVGLLLGDQRLADTFYGVAPALATSSRPAFAARAGLISTRLSFNLSRRLSTDWRLFAYARTDSVAGAANRDSPLVDRREGVSAGLALAWTGWRSTEAGSP